eukprot:3209065-Amphidinium_carterae.1
MSFLSNLEGLHREPKWCDWHLLQVTGVVASPFDELSHSPYAGMKSTAQAPNWAPCDVYTK